jgi:hypothetical protein
MAYLVDYLPIRKEIQIGPLPQLSPRSPRLGHAGHILIDQANSAAAVRGQGVPTARLRPPPRRKVSRSLR